MKWPGNNKNPTAKYTAYLVYYIYLQKHRYIYKWTSYKTKFQVILWVKCLQKMLVLQSVFIFQTHFIGLPSFVALSHLALISVFFKYPIQLSLKKKIYMDAQVDQ